MNLSGLSAIYPGYIQGQDDLARLAVAKEKADAIKRQAAIETASGRSLMGDGGVGGAAPPGPGGLGGLSSAPPPPPQGPGQPSVPMQPGPGGPPQPGMSSGGPPQGAPPQQPQGAAPQGGMPAPQQTPGMSSLQQMAQQVMRANPGVDFKSPEGARMLVGVIEKNQQLLAPQDKQDLATIKLTMEMANKARDLEIKAQRADTAEAQLAVRKEIETMREESAAHIQQLRDAGMNQRSDAKAAQAADALDKRLAALEEQTRIKEGGKDSRLDKTEAGKTDRLGTQEAGRNSRSDAGIASREKIAGNRTDAQLGQLAAKNGVNIPYGTPPEEAQGMIAKAVAAKMDKGTLSDDEAQFVADAMKTDPSFISHATGSGPAGTANKKKVLAILAQPGFMEPEKLAQAKVALAGATAEQRKISGQAGNVALGTKELDQFAPMVVAAAKKVNRTQYPTINSIVQAAERKTGSPEIVTLGNNIQALKSAYTQVLVRGGSSSVEARQRTDELINPSMSPAQLDAAIASMYQEGKGAAAAAKNASADVAANISGKGKPAEAPAAEAAADPFGIR